jgi:hypothetical protein
MQVFLRRPTAYPEWVAEYDMAAKRLNNLQEGIATTPGTNPEVRSIRKDICHEIQPRLVAKKSK